MRKALVILLVAASAALADVTFTARQSECLGALPDSDDTIDVEVRDCVVHIFHRNVVTNCCLAYEPDVTFDGVQIAVTEIDNGPPCDCICPFDLELAIEGLQPGTYAIVMKAFNHSESITMTVTVPPCEYWLIGKEIWSTLGTKGVEFPVHATNPKPVEGFSLGTTYPLEHANMVEMNFKDTVTDLAGIEFVVVDIHNEDAADGRGWATCSMILDVTEPFDRQTIPAGKEQRIINFVYDLLPPSGSIPRSMSVPFVAGLGKPPVKIVFSVAGQDVVPEVQNGIIQLTYPAQFVRCDANGNGDITIADPIYLLSYLFAKGPRPPCMDAADANDDGEITIADPIKILSYLFQHGTVPPPSPPGPPGPDPTLDELGCERPAAAE